MMHMEIAVQAQCRWCGKRFLEPAEVDIDDQVHIVPHAGATPVEPIDEPVCPSCRESLDARARRVLEGLA
jgi:hypothetical protein